MKIHALISQLFGKFTWISPPWLTYHKQKANLISKKGWLILFFGFCFFTAAYGAFYWYQSLPKPDRIIAKITAPAISSIDNGLVTDALNIDFGVSYHGDLTSRSVAPLQVVGKEVTNGITLNPVMPGQWRWSSDNHLVFTPKKDWPAGQTYTVSFDKNFFKVGTKMKDWYASFSTLPMKAKISEFKFYQDPRNPQVHQAVATVNFNFPVDPTTFSKKVSLAWQTLNKNNQATVNTTVDFDKYYRTAYIHSDALPMLQQERFLVLQLARGINAVSGPSSTTDDQSKKVLIPDANSFFKVSHLSTAIVRNQHDQPEQVLSLETSLGVTQNSLNKSVHAYLLPQAYPATSAEEAKPNYQWRDPGEVTPAILASSTPITLNAIPAEREYATLHHFKYHVETPAYIYVTLDKGITGAGDLKLANTYAAILNAPAYPQEISFLHKGALLALGSEEKLSVLVRGLSAVKFDIARVLPNELNHLVTQTSGNFSDPYFTQVSFNQNNISEIFSEIQPFDATRREKAQYTALDLSKYLNASEHSGGPRGLFLLRAQGWDTIKKMQLPVQAKRLVLITDLGLIVKDNRDGTHDVFVQSIIKGTPVNNATVSLLGKNGLPVLTRNTDSQGHAIFPQLKEIYNEHEPTVYLVSNGSDMSFIPYSRSDRELNYSRYDIGGITNNESALSAFIYTDRGIYRPGDTVHVAMIAKQPHVSFQPAGLPLEATIVDSRGMTVSDQKITLNDTGYLSFDFPTSDTSATGQYEINLYIVKDNHASNLIGSTNLHVDEFLPDRMQIKAVLSQQSPGWISPSTLKANVNLRNLYGTPAANHRVHGKMLITPQTITFNQFPHYIFSDPLLNPKIPPKVFADTLSEVRTNQQGQADFDLKLDRFEKATYELTFFAEGFEAEGGRSVTTQTRALVSPLSYLVGYKSDGDLNYIKQHTVRQIHLIAIDPQLKQRSLNNVTLQINKLQPVSTLVKKEDGTYQYQSIIQTTAISNTALSITQEGNNYTLPTQQLGDYLIRIMDQNGSELSKLKYSVIGDSQQPLPKNAELTVKLNKVKFNAGDEIEMQISAPYTGAGLITLERDKVYAYQWFKADTTSSVQKIKIPADFQGDGYVNIAFVRDFNSSEIFVSPLSYSVLPFSVTHEDHEINIDLNTPTLAKPGSPLVINYKTDKPSKIIVFAVDEGILQVSKYQTPDPLSYFFQKHALEVKTQQIVDQILPKFIADRELSSVGGDGGEAYINKNLNPFKRKTDAPVVYWSGILDSDTTQKQLTYTIPDYFNGSVRIMAVAVASSATGSAARSTQVRGDFIINPNVPTFVAPNDEFSVNATVANNLQGSGSKGSVSIQLRVSPNVEIMGPDKKSVIIPEGQESSVDFRVKAKTRLGATTLSFTASSQNKSSSLTSTLSVRPSMPYSTMLSSGYTTNKNKAFTIHSTFYPEYKNTEMAVSSSPLILVSGLTQYLNDYPYGCVEQLVSKAFPWLAMSEQPWFATDKLALSEKIQKTIELLAQRQVSSGAFNYWPGVSEQNTNFPSIYAMHFLTEAKEQGYVVPKDIFSTGIGFLKELASQEVKTLDEARDQAYAIYLLTRNEIVTTNYLTNLQLTLEQNNDFHWQNDIVSIYIASTYQLLKNSQEAEKILANYQFKTMDQETDFNNETLTKAQYLYLLAKHFPQQLTPKIDALITDLVKALNAESMSTIIAANASLALSSVGQYYQSIQASELTMEETLDNQQQQKLTAASKTYARAKVDPNAMTIKVNNPGKQGYFYQLTQAGYDKELPTRAIHQGIELIREYKNAERSQVQLGDEIEVHIRLRSTDVHDHSNVAIIDLLPGGFEVVRGSIKAAMNYIDIREDRIIFFGSVTPDSDEISYKIKATSQGKFTVPPIFGMAMYDPDVKSLGTASAVSVVQK